MESFGAPLTDLSDKDFTNRELVYQIGIPPNRIDILMDIGPVDFQDAWKNKVLSSYGEIPISIIGKEELAQVKRYVGRPQDLIDVSKLEEYDL